MNTTLFTPKRFAFARFALLLLLTAAAPARAAVPSFDSFNTNDFSVVKTTAPWVIYSKRTGVTNIYNGSVIINTNTFITNVNSTITITNSFLTITNTIFNINGSTNIGHNVIYWEDTGPDPSGPPSDVTIAWIVRFRDGYPPVTWDPLDSAWK